MNDIDWLKIVFLGLGILFIISLPFQLYNQCQRQKWLEQNCKIIGEMSSSSSVGIGTSSNGSLAMVPVFIPGKTGYQCNDGKQYWE